MYYPEDQFHPNTLEHDVYSHSMEDYDDENTFVSGSEYQYSVSSNKKKKSFDSFKTMDKGYHKLKREYHGKKIAVELYTTGYTPGTTIRDAVTGSRYVGNLVGSRDEDQFFKVKILDSEMGRDQLQSFTLVNGLLPTQ